MPEPDWEARAEAIAGDRDAGASEILGRLLPLLEEARVLAPEALPVIAEIVRRLQPAMAGLSWACAAAEDDARHPGRLAQAAAQVRRAPTALTRVAVDAFTREAPAATWNFVTWSYSSAVAAFLETLATQGEVHATCAEGRPRYEGRRLAARLSAAGIRVTLTTDAAACARLSDRTAVAVGADAVTPEGWINKVGTAALAAAAREAGVPVLVLASREKFVDTPHVAAGALQVRGEAGEVWTPEDSAIRVANPTFELVPLSLAHLVITDRDVLSPDQLSVGRFDPGRR